MNVGARGGAGGGSPASVWATIDISYVQMFRVHEIKINHRLEMLGSVPSLTCIVDTIV